MKQPWQEAALFNTVLIQVYRGKIYQGSGTGFFVLWAAAGGSEGFFLYLVSNRHVLAHDASLTYKLQLHGRSGLRRLASDWRTTKRACG